MRKKVSLMKFIYGWGVVFLMGLGVSIVAIDFIKSYRDASFRAGQMRKTYIADRKQTTKQEVDRVVERIRYEIAQSERLTKNKIKTRVYEAFSIAQNIYQQNKTVKSEADIQQMILDALRPIRFEDGSGYYFATRMDGVEVLFADRPQLEGANLLNMQDTRGQYVIKDLIDIATQYSEGFYQYHWTKPGSAENDNKKISFIKRFDPYHWMIGTGLYVDDVERQVKADLLSAVSRIRFGKEGYIFINTFDGDALVSNGKLFSGTKKLWEIFNDNPEKMKVIFEKEHAAALKPHGDYIHYAHIKLTSPAKQAPKVSFIYGIPELQWLVGAGVYLDDVEADIALMQTELNHQIKAKLFYFTLIVIVIVGLFLMLFNWFNRRLKRDSNLFMQFFGRAAHSDEEIDRDNIKFIELDRIAEYANNMLTARKAAEKTLKESDSRYRLHFEHVSDIIYTIDPELKLLDISPSVERVLGYTPRELIGRPFQDLNVLAPEYLESAFSDTMRILAGERITPAVYQFVARDGTRKWGEVSGAPLILDNQVVAIISVARDITKRKQIEGALKESEAKYRSMMEAMTDPVYICSHDFRIDYMNPAMIKKVGRDGTGGLCHKTIFDEDKQCPWCKFDQIQQGKNVADERKDPKTGRYYFINSSPVPRVDGPASQLSIFRDITDLKMMEKERIAAEAKLQQALKMESIGTLAGGIAHDFNNILSSVIGYTELSLDEVEGNTLLEDNLKEIYTAGLRAKELVKQILTFARQSNNEIKPVQAGIIVKEALKFLRSSIPTTIDIRQNIQSDSLIMGDPTQVHQILMNLCTNAVQAMGEKNGVLTVDLTDVRLDADFTKSYENFIPGDYLKLSVSDTGVGIEPDIIGSIFEPYFTTKGPGEGTGMGLSTTHGIIKQYGGEIIVDSEVGRGTILNVYLPVTRKRTIEKPYQAKPLPSGTERILFVDDELPIAKMGGHILQHLGYHVTVRTGSVEALALFKSGPDQFDLVITDMTMPNMTGDKLAMELMKIRPNIPVILCTGYSKKISGESAASIGIKAFASKPIVKADLAKTVRRVLDQANINQGGQAL